MPKIGSGGGGSRLYGWATDTWTKLVASASGYLTVVLGAGTAAIGKLAANAGVDIGDVGYKPYTTAKSGQITVTTAGTAVVGTTEAGNLFAIKAHPDNTDVIWVGNDGANDVAATNGFPLKPGETIVLNVSNLNKLYFDADVSGEKACWIKLA